MDEKDLKDYLMKEVDTVQSVIKRMSHNSFLIKGWAITLIVVTLLLKGTDEQIFLAFVPLMVFWFLDSYFLRQERMYRELYKWVVSNRLKTEDHLLSMDASRFEDNINSQFKTMFSITLIWFYGSIVGLITIYEILIFSISYGNT